MINQLRKPIRLGIVGAGRGKSYMSVADSIGFKLVAICDIWEEKLEQISPRGGEEVGQ